MVKSPFPYFGGKSDVQEEVWRRMGSVQNFVEPFAGSAAVSLNAPKGVLLTLNDADGYVSNVWRSIKENPNEVAAYATDACMETDLFARHVWLLKRKDTLANNLKGNPDYFDAKAAGWWIWGVCNWIGRDWCSGKGPWSADDDGNVTYTPRGIGVTAQMPQLAGNPGVKSMRAIEVGNKYRDAAIESVTRYIKVLSGVLFGARVLCGNWDRALTPTVIDRPGKTGIFFDPPYGTGDIEYAVNDGLEPHITEDVQKWCVENGDNPNYRIAVCGYDIKMPEGWVEYRWTAVNGYRQRDEIRDNRYREVIWFNRHALNHETLTLF